jgi:hypothetical protein
MLVDLQQLSTDAGHLELSEASLVRAPLRHSRRRMQPLAAGAYWRA